MYTHICMRGNTRGFARKQTRPTLDFKRDLFPHIRDLYQIWINKTVFTRTCALTQTAHKAIAGLWMDSMPILLLVCVIWIIYRRDWTYSHLWRDSSGSVPSLIHARDMTHATPSLIYKRAMIHSYLWHDLFICVTWLICVFDTCYSCVWYDSLIRVTMSYWCECHDLCVRVTQLCHVWRDSCLRVT